MACTARDPDLNVSHGRLVDHVPLPASASISDYLTGSKISTIRPPESIGSGRKIVQIRVNLDINYRLNTINLPDEASNTSTTPGQGLRYRHVHG